MPSLSSRRSALVSLVFIWNYFLRMETRYSPETHMVLLDICWVLGLMLTVCDYRLWRILPIFCGFVIPLTGPCRAQQSHSRGLLGLEAKSAQKQPCITEKMVGEDRTAPHGQDSSSSPLSVSSSHDWKKRVFISAIVAAKLWFS